MKTYLVGGAVRDKLMGYPHHEHDWVVVGATPEQLLQQGYQKVGRDFPVFLHPQTRDEYALARTERKQGTGYYGFTCDFNPQVSIEEDLARRDLTINAMAMDEAGQLIDPYGGYADLQARILRHVSPAFVEDPVRVLRVARFAARYHHLGFQIAPATRLLMYRIARTGELTHLVPERVWQEWHGSLLERNPEQFINVLRQVGALKAVLPEIDVLFGVPNSRRYHGEVDTGIHTLMVMEQTVQLSIEPLVRFAAWVHDLGKGATPMRQWPKQSGHEELGVSVIEKLGQRLRIPADYRKFAQMVSRYHLHIHRFTELRSDTIVKVLEQTDAFRRPQQFNHLLTVCQADGLGRIGASDYPQADAWREALRLCMQINARDVIAQGKQGVAVRNAMHVLRVQAIKTWKKHEK